MICIASHRPVLQVGPCQVVNYDLCWITEALTRAAELSGMSTDLFAPDIQQAIQHYLEKKCPLSVLPLESLYDRIRHMLTRIGMENVAENLPVVAPPLTLSLTRYVESSQEGLEMHFYENLRKELKELLAHGASELTFTDLYECSTLLAGKAEWDEQCEQLSREIEAFIHVYSKQFRKIHSHDHLPKNH